MKIVLASDNHRDLDSIKTILNNEPIADFYLHCGDSGTIEEAIAPFASVKGNNDFIGDYPKERIIDIEGHRILLIHGHREIYYNSFEDLANMAKEKNCDICFFGHIHMFVDKTIKGVRLINPGSTYYNRDGSKPCYAIVYIKGKNIKVEQKFL